MIHNGRVHVNVRRLEEDPVALDLYRRCRDMEAYLRGLRIITTVSSTSTGNYLMAHQWNHISS